MPRDLFGDVTRPSIAIGNRKWYTVPLSLLSHSAIVTAAIVIPLLATDVLPKPWEKMGGVVIPIAPVPPSPPPIKAKDRPIEPPVNPNAAPTGAPDGFTPEKPIDAGWEDRVASPSVIDGDFDPAVVVAPPPAVVTPPAPVKVGGSVRAPAKIHHVDPEYSPIARAAQAQGMVIIEATIGEDGQVINARVLRPVMVLLDQAALAAVRQWRFTPTLLNGVPVPVIMTVTVNFTLKR